MAGGVACGEQQVIESPLSEPFIVMTNTKQWAEAQVCKYKSAYLPTRELFWRATSWKAKTKFRSHIFSIWCNTITSKLQNKACYLLSALSLSMYVELSCPRILRSRKWSFYWVPKYQARSTKTLKSRLLISRDSSTGLERFCRRSDSTNVFCRCGQEYVWLSTESNVFRACSGVWFRRKRQKLLWISTQRAHFCCDSAWKKREARWPSHTSKAGKPSKMTLFLPS